MYLIQQIFAAKLGASRKPSELQRNLKVLREETLFFRIKLSHTYRLVENLGESRDRGCFVLSRYSEKRVENREASRKKKRAKCSVPKVYLHFLGLQSL